MSFVFGWNSFRLKSYDPQSLNLSDQPNPGYIIELRQKYFHLFWIPFFGIGKKWAIRRGNKLYELPLEQEQHLESLPAPRAPWYTFAGTILVIAGLAVFLVMEKTGTAKQERRARNEFTAELKALSDKFNTTDTFDYYKADPESYRSKYVVLKVQEVRQDSITFRKAAIEARGDELSPGKMKQLFLTGGEAIDTVTLAKRMLQKAMERDFDYAGGDRGVDLFGGSQLYIIKEIVKVP